MRAAARRTKNAPTMTDDERAALRAKLGEEIGPVHGSDLGAHLRRDGVLVVDAGVSLLECAVAIAADDRSMVAAWLASGALRRPTDDERAAWPVDEARRWLAAIVRPFVLVQALDVAPD